MMRAALCGLLAMFVSIGVARFGFAPLVPALAKAHWYNEAAAFWLGTANLAGYFIGAAIMRVWTRAFAAKAAVLLFMGLTALSMLGSGLNWGWLWFGFWRLLSGITAGILMVMMAAAIVGRAPPNIRGRISGITFAGMGSGTAASALLVPWLVGHGLEFTWLSLGGICVVATIIVAILMPESRIQPVERHEVRGAPPLPVILLITAYGLTALGFVPHMLFLSSFAALGLHRGIAAGAELSAWLGISAMLGPIILGRIADKIGFLRTLGFGYVAMCAGVATPLLFHAQYALILSAISVGAVGLGSVMLVSGAIAGMVAAPRLAGDWGLATMVYAVMQAVVAAMFSNLFHITGSYALLFGIGSIAIGCAIILLLIAGILNNRRHPT